ncbi:MAG: hypothetical protein ACXAC5_01315 [Promethearchaeota archaeon]|jgi:hypothetical protein
MIIDTTISTADNFLNKLATQEITEEARKSRGFPPGIYTNRKERFVFRELYVREFLEKNGRNSDWDLNFSMVVWKGGEVIGVFAADDYSNGDIQSISELLELPQS